MGFSLTKTNHLGGSPMTMETLLLWKNPCHQPEKWDTGIRLKNGESFGDGLNDRFTIPKNRVLSGESGELIRRQMKVDFYR